MRTFAEFLQPTQIAITAQDGTELQFFISKFPATVGRRIVTQYPITGAPRVGDYDANVLLMHMMLGFTAAVTDAGPVVLSTEALIDNHTRDYETLMRLEYAMMEYNCSFLRAGKLSNYLELVTGKFNGLITEILTRYSQQSSEKK